MKKLILLAVLITVAFLKPTNAQVNLSINIGARPYYQPVYYSDPRYVYVEQPVYVHRTHYVPARRVVVRNSYYRVPSRVYTHKKVYRSSYSRSAPRYYGSKHHYKGPKHFKRQGHGKHGRH